MTISGVNQTKNSVSPINQDRLGFFLLTESSDFLMTEDSYYIVVDLPSYGLDGTNQTKNTVSPTNSAKS